MAFGQFIIILLKRIATKLVNKIGFENE